jgi:predicted phosphodiesterase
MRYAFISDVHANIEALETSLSAIEELGVDSTLCLGDVVGYHANPNECIDLLRSRRIPTIAGNHDRAAAGLIDPRDFSDVAGRAIRWTRSVLTGENVAYLGDLPLTLSMGDFVAVHAGWDPRPNERLHMNETRARRNLEVVPERHASDLGFFGHTHFPLAYERNIATGAVAVRKLPLLRLVPGHTYLVNPGSVGQARDGDPRASLLIYDAAAQTIGWHRIEYDRDSCLRKAKDAGLVGGPSAKRRAAMAYGQR